MEPTTILPPIYDQVKAYIETKFKLLKLEAINTLSAIFAEMVVDVVIILLSLIAFIFFSITLALFVAYLLHSSWKGFGCVTALYIVIAISTRILKIYLQNIFIRKSIQKLFKHGI